MKNLAFPALAGLLLATGAAAQTADNPTYAPYTPFPVHTYDASAYIDGHWTLPTPEQMKAAWPVGALKGGIESGHVTIDCAIAASGRFASCDIVSESPRGYGFASAAFKAYVRFAHVDPASVTGGLTVFSRRRFDIVFAN